MQFSKAKIEENFLLRVNKLKLNNYKKIIYIYINRAGDEVL